MKIVLATGIYPPKIGGPATYCHKLAEELSKEHEVVVVTYGAGMVQESGFRNQGSGINVVWVPLQVPILRWFRYANQLKAVGKDADVVYCFSSVSCGVPLILSGLKTPKKVLRLGGDFFWERYTDRGGRLSLRNWYSSQTLLIRFQKTVMELLLNRFHHIVFSTDFQQEIYEKSYKKLPEHSVITNALMFDGPYEHEHSIHSPCRLLFMGRFVKFKNIETLIQAMANLEDAVLSVVGSGPLENVLRKLADDLHLQARVQFFGPAHGVEKQEIFKKHDMLVIPSLTDISPNVALEAKAAGLRVLITNENGLGVLNNAMYLHPMNSVHEVVEAINEARDKYNLCDSTSDHVTHSWSEVASETLALFATLGKQ